MSDDDDESWWIEAAATLAGRQLGAMDVKLARSMMLLKRLEWCVDGIRDMACPMCHASKASGHDPACALGQFMQPGGPVVEPATPPAQASTDEGGRGPEGGPLCVGCGGQAVVQNARGAPLCRPCIDKEHEAQARAIMAQAEGGMVIAQCGECWIFYQAGTTCGHIAATRGVLCECDPGSCDLSAAGLEWHPGGAICRRAAAEGHKREHCAGCAAGKQICRACGGDGEEPGIDPDRRPMACRKCLATGHVLPPVSSGMAGSGG